MYWLDDQSGWAFSSQPCKSPRPRKRVLGHPRWTLPRSWWRYSTVYMALWVIWCLVRNFSARVFLVCCHRLVRLRLPDVEVKELIYRLTNLLKSFVFRIVAIATKRSIDCQFAVSPGLYGPFKTGYFFPAPSSPYFLEDVMCVLYEKPRRENFSSIEPRFVRGRKNHT